MHTQIALTSLGLGEACAKRAFALAFECVEALEERLSTRVAGSELMRLWDAKASVPLRVSDCLWQLLRLSNELAFRTDGLFDAVAAGSAGSARWTDMDLSVRGYVTLRRRLRIDLGGLVKGYAADIAVQALCEAGVRRGIVDVGGVMRGFGQQEWRVQYHLDDGAQPLPIPLIDGALAGCGSSARTLYDPKSNIVHSGREWPDLRLLVRAPTATLADGLTKVALLAPAKAHCLLPKLGAAAAVLTPEGAHSLAYAS